MLASQKHGIREYLKDLYGKGLLSDEDFNKGMAALKKL